MSTTARLFMAEDLEHMPSSDSRYKLVKGELRPRSPAGSKNGIIIARPTVVPGRHVEENNPGELFGAETGFEIASNPDTVRAPDLAFVKNERIPAGDFTEQFWPGPPDLAFEVISPTDTLYEVDEKVEDYLASGVTLVWIINPKKQTATVYRPGSEAQILTSEQTLDGYDVMPGFQYPVAKFFATRRG